MIGGPPGMAHLVFSRRPGARPGRLVRGAPRRPAHLLPGWPTWPHPVSLAPPGSAAPPLTCANVV